MGGGPGRGWRSRAWHLLSGCGQAVVLAVVDALSVAGRAVAPGLARRAVVQPAGQVRVIGVRDGILAAGSGVAGRSGRDDRVGGDGDAVVAELGVAGGGDWPVSSLVGFADQDAAESQRPAGDGPKAGRGLASNCRLMSSVAGPRWMYRAGAGGLLLAAG